MNIATGCCWVLPESGEPHAGVRGPAEISDGARGVCSRKMVQKRGSLLLDVAFMYSFLRPTDLILVLLMQLVGRSVLITDP